VGFDALFYRKGGPDGGGKISALEASAFEQLLLEPGRRATHLHSTQANNALFAAIMEGAKTENFCRTSPLSLPEVFTFDQCCFQQHRRRLDGRTASETAHG